MTKKHPAVTGNSGPKGSDQWGLLWYTPMSTAINDNRHRFSF
jgi:hypothetical protein